MQDPEEELTDDQDASHAGDEQSPSSSTSQPGTESSPQKSATGEGKHTPSNQVFYFHTEKLICSAKVLHIFFQPKNGSVFVYNTLENLMSH